MSNTAYSFKNYKNNLRENEGRGDLEPQGSTGSVEIGDDDSNDNVSPEELMDLVAYAIETSTQEELNYLADEILEFIDSDDDRMYEEDEELEEARTRRFTGKTKGKRKFSGASAKTAQQLKRDKATNKTKNRQKRIAQKAYKRKNRVATKKYAKSYAAAVKSGKHQARTHRGAKK